METASTYNDDLYVMRENLRSLRTAFFVLFVGSILTIVPLVDIIGSILLFIGIILLIIALGRLGNSNMVNAGYYKTTRNWLILDIIASILAVAIIYYFLYSMIISPTISSAALSSKPPSISPYIFNEFFFIIGASVAVLLVIYIFAYLKVAGTLKLLSTELSVPKLGSASTTLKISLLFSALTSVIAIISLYTGLRHIVLSSSGNGGLVFTGIPVFQLFGLLSYTFILAIVAFVLEVIAYHEAYTGLDEFFVLADYKLQQGK